MKNRLFTLFGLLLMLLPYAQGQGRKKNIESLYKREDINRSIRLVNASRINTDLLEFSPTYYQKGLVYVSQKRSGLIDEQQQQTFYELFYADLDPNGLPVRRNNFSVEIYSELYEGPVTFNRQFDRIYFTRSNINKGVAKQGKNRRIHLKIFEAQRGEYGWENLRELPFNSDDFSSMHPALSPDGTKLFFASNRPGGFGGMDLYSVEKKEGRWLNPVNLGPDINTPGNESFPFLHESGTLFFTSDTHPGFGGLDIFAIDISGRSWGKVLNLGEPFNSPEDDLGLVIDKEGERGYFSSNRVGGAGGDDIYFFEAFGGIRGMEIPDTYRLVVTVYDGQASKRLMNSDIRIYRRTEDGLIDNQELYDLELMPSDAYGEMVMKLVRKKEKYLGDPHEVTDRQGEAVLLIQEEQEYIILVSKDGYASKEMTYKLAKDAPIKPLEVVLEPRHCVELTGSVRALQSKKPIPGTLVRIISQCDNQEILTRSKFDGVFEACLEIGCDYTIIAEKPGFDSELTRMSLVKVRGSRSAEVDILLNPKDEMYEKEPIRKGTVIVLENIYYDFNKSAIRRGAARELEGLARLMLEYPSMEIRLGAHTDCRGTDEYNLELSEQRAVSAKQFLVDRGVAPTRIRTVGYGETQPRNRCDCESGIECSEREHQYNRRTEVRIIKIDEPLEVNYRN